MADQTCVKELNAQLQVMRSRLDTVEKNVRANIVSSFTHVLKTFAGFGALIGGVGAPAVALFLADPLLMMMVAAVVGVDGWKEVIEWVEDNMGADFSQLFARMMLDQLGLPSYPGAISSALEAQIAQEIYDQEQLILWLIENGTPEEVLAAQAVLQEMINAYDSLTSALACQNNLSICKTASSILNVV